MKKLLSLFICPLLLIACQPTPEQEAIVAPTGYEAAILNQQSLTTDQNAVVSPAHWNEVIKLKYWDINIDADVSPNVTGTLPVYESAYVTMNDIQAQADNVKRGLLKNAETCCEDGVMSKADWYRQIQLFADTPVWDDKIGGYTRYHSEEEIVAYRKDLSSFIDEVPNELEYYSFSPKTDPIPDDASYQLSDGSLAWMRCDEKSITILYGADIFYNAVDQTELCVLQGGAVPGEPVGTQIEGVMIDEKSAVEQALSLMSDLTLEGYKIAEAEKARYINDYSHDVITAGYRIILCRAEGDYAAAGDTISNKLSNREDSSQSTAYRPYWDQEQIWIFVDKTGVRSFWWDHPTARPQSVNENVAILSFEEIQGIIKTHLTNCFSFEEDDELFKEWYAGRAKYVVDNVGLYFGMIPKKNDVNAFYYGPVWIVTVRTYPADVDVPALPYTMHTQYLHINAIDGSLISY